MDGHSDCFGSHCILLHVLLVIYVEEDGGLGQDGDGRDGEVDGGDVQVILYARDEQDLLENLDLELLGVKTLASILIEPSLATDVLLDSCLV